jgi:predicted amidophosphoribosyltransferase
MPIKYDDLMKIVKATSLDDNYTSEHLVDYHPYWIYPDGVKTHNPHYDAMSRMVYNVKEQEQAALNHFAKLLASKLGKGDYAIAYVPSSDKDKKVSGIRRIAQHLPKHGYGVDATSCINRHTSRPKSHSGAGRSVQSHYNTLEIVDVEKIKGKTVILLDDVSTTGNSLKACAQLLLNAGATTVKGLSLGQTKWED